MTIAIIVWVMFWFYWTLRGVLKSSSVKTNGDFYMNWFCTWVSFGWAPVMTVYFILKYL